jgi:hypothetical protein
MYTVRAFHVPEEVAVLGISLYVLGFALGPLIFAPLGEVSPFYRLCSFENTLCKDRCTEG